MTAHWGVEDPAAVERTDDLKRAAFEKAYRDLEARIKIFATIPVATLDATQLKARIEQIGRSQ